MAEVSRVILQEGQTQTTLIDLQEDTATPDKVLYGYKFHQKNGEVKTGTYVEPTLGTKNITANGNYSASSDSLSGYSSVSVAVPNKVPSIADGSITSLTAEDLAGVSSIRPFAFYNCTSLTSVTIPNDVVVIGNDAFNGCEHLTGLALPNSVQTIGNYAFAECNRITTITIPSGVRHLFDEVFYYCTGLTTINYNAEYLTTGPTDKGTFESAGSDTNGTAVVIGDSVQEIPSYLFGVKFSSNIKTISVGYNVTTIGANAFSGNANITSITINASTIPALANVNAFDGTNNCPIYVPADMVSDYQSANVWSSLSSRIQAIPE